MQDTATYPLEVDLISREVRSGLTASICTIASFEDVTSVGEIESCLYFGAMVFGPGRSVTINGDTTFLVEPSRPFLLGFNETASFGTRYMPGDRFGGVSLEMNREFLLPLANGSDDGAFHTVLELLEKSLYVQRFNQPSLINQLAGLLMRSKHDQHLAALQLESYALAMVVDIAANAGATYRPKPVPLSGRDQRRVRDLSRFLIENAANPPSLSEMSRMAGLNPTSLSIHFKEVHGCSIFAFLRKHRLSVARDMLQNTEDAISEIGYRIGFRNAAAFSTAYRKEFGLSPSAERKSR